MAYRRNLITKVTQYTHPQRYTPSFSYITRNDDDHKPPQNPQTSYFLHRQYSTSWLGFGERGLGDHTLFGVRNMSMKAGIGEEKIEYMTDVASVLNETAVSEVGVASQVPAVSEVAVAAADSYLPVAALQYVIDGVHNFTGLNWWASIALTTLLIRGLTVPLMINQLKATSKLTLMRPRLEEIKQEMQDKGMAPTAVADGQQRMAKIFKEYGVTPWTPLKGILIQGPVFLSFFLGIQNMVEKVPSFKTGGAFWFTDLTTPDTLYVLPVLTALSFWITVECNMQEGMEGNPAASTMKKVSRVFALLTVPLTMNFPKAIFCYWITSNLFSLLYGLVIKKPAVKKFFNVPIIPVAPPSTTPQQPAFSFFDALKKFVAAQQQASTPMIPPSKPTSPTTTESKPTNQRIPPASVLSQRIKTLEKEVKGRKKNKRR